MNDPNAGLGTPGLATPAGVSAHWKPALILALPFLVVIAAFDGLAQTFPTFHFDDEVLYHWPIIQRFFAELPWPAVRDYESATGPLFHVAFAFAAKLVGLDLQTLRLLNVAVSLLAVAVFYGLVARVAQQRETLLLTLLFAVSPYFFGASFLVLTDNFGILLALLALRALFNFWERKRTADWVAFCVFVCLAVLTRQLYVWLAIGAVLAMLAQRVPLRDGLPRVAGLALAGVPLLTLVVIWGGLTPPTFQQHHVAAAAITPRAVVFGMSVFGMFWLALFPDRFLASLRMLRAKRYLPLAAILLVTVVVLLLVPTTPQYDDNGILWRLSRAMPEVAGTRIVFWLLFPVGLLFFWNAAQSRDRLAVGTMLLALAFLSCNLPNAKVFEKYYDPMTIALVILVEARARSALAWGRYSRPLLLLAFLAYPVISWKLAAAP